jgi:twitching motility protein PilT
MSLSLSDLLKRMLEMSGSDLHITTNSPPQVRVHGHLVPLDLPQMTPAETKQLAYSVMTRRSIVSKSISSSTSHSD